MNDTSREMITDCFIKALYYDLVGDDRQARVMIGAAEALYIVAVEPDERLFNAVEKVRKLT